MDKKEYYKEASQKLIVTPRMHEIINEVYKYMYNETVLDVGCGNRIITTFMSLHNNVTGIDIEEDIYTWYPEKQTKYSVVCLFDVLEHLEKPWTILGKVDDLLLTNGTFWVNLPEQEDINQPYDKSVDVYKLIHHLRTQYLFKLLKLRWYAISENESYNFMIFRKLK